MQLMRLISMVLLSGLCWINSYATDSENKISTKELEGESRSTLVRVFKAQANQKTVIRIRDMQGYILHREVISGTTTKRFNFSQLEEGRYIIEARTDGKKTEEVITIEESQSIVYFRPAVRLRKNQVDVMFENPTSNELTLRVYTEHGSVLHEEKIETRKEFAKTLDLSRLKRGGYTLSIVGKGCAFSRDLKVK